MNYLKKNILKSHYKIIDSISKHFNLFYHEGYIRMLT